MTKSLFFGVASALACWGVCLSHVSAADVFVDNLKGDDRYDGTSARVNSDVSGPVATISRGLALAKQGDRIVIANNDRPYHESLRVAGRHLSGFVTSDLVIEGNGAMVSGARPVPPTAWEDSGDRLWKLTPWRKGFYLLLRGGSPVPETPCPTDAPEVPDLEEGHWCAWRGSMYYRSGETELPPEEDFEFAAESVGLTMFRIENVTIRDLTFQHFRVDGVGAPNLCENVTLVNVTAKENGRAGFAVSGAATVRLEGCTAENNRKHSVLVTGLGAADLDECQIDQPVTVRD